MKNPIDGKLLRVFVRENEKWQGRPLYEAIVDKARQEGLAGATVMRCLAGYGCKHEKEPAKKTAAGENPPVVVEIVDSAESLEKFIPKLDGMIQEGLATLLPAQVAIYKARM